MNLEALAQDVFDKREDVSNNRLALSRVKIALSEARTRLSEALIATPSQPGEQLAIVLKDHVVICEWDVDGCKYTTNFVSKVPNANT